MPIKKSQNDKWNPGNQNFILKILTDFTFFVFLMMIIIIRDDKGTILTRKHGVGLVRKRKVR